MPCARGSRRKRRGSTRTCSPGSRKANAPVCPLTLRAAGLYGLIALSGILLLAGWQALDGAWTVTGYKSQILALLLAQALVLGRIALRLVLLGGPLSLYRRYSSL